MEYAIKHKTNGQFFSSFEHGPEFTPIWTDIGGAKRWTEREHATSQAVLLRRFDHHVQIKPVAIVEK